MEPNRAGYILDLDGTLIRGGTMIEGADVLVSMLSRSGTPYLILTNNSSRTTEAVAEQLQSLGIAVEAQQIMNSAQGAAAYVAEQFPGKSVYMIGEAGLEIALRGEGIQLAEGDAEVVVQGIDRKFDYAKLAQASRLIREGAPYVLTNPDLLLPTDDGLTPGAGTIGAAIEAAGRKKPIVIGKPSAIIMEMALRRLGLPPNQVYMVGDNMMTDIRAGADAGCPTMLVLTGVTTRETMQQWTEQSGVRADHTFEGLEELSSYISSL